MQVPNYGLLECLVFPNYILFLGRIFGVSIIAYQNAYFHASMVDRPLWNKNQYKYLFFNLLLCWNTLVVAPESRRPKIREAWFFPSLKTRQPLETNVGKLRALVANPMPKVMASSVPKNLAVVCSSSKWIGKVPET